MELLAQLVSNVFTTTIIVICMFVAGAMELILGGYESDSALDSKIHTKSIDDISSNGERCRQFLLITL